MTRHYSSTAQPTTLTAGVSDSATVIPVAATTGFPAVDFVLALDYQGVAQELVLVTGVAGLNLTVTRGYNGTTAVAHNNGAAVVHTHAAIDFTDSRTHEAATSAHGVAGALVGTSDTQSLSNKNLTDPTNTFPSSLATDAEVTSAISTHNASSGRHGVTGSVVGTTDAQTLTNKTISLGSNTVSMTKAQLNTAVSDADVATIAGTETLTGKTLTSPTITDAVLTKGGKSQLPLIVCTSATRPSHVEGQAIYETDTELTYISDGATWRSARGGLGSIVTFNASGTFTKASYPGLRGVKVTVVGSGGNGGRANATGPTISNGAGGGSGGVDGGYLDASSLLASETVTVAAGGSGQNAGGDGLDGATSSFGAHYSATGGGGGTAGSTSLGIAAGGSAGSGSLADGSKGQIGYALTIGSTDVNFHMGDGAASAMSADARNSHSGSSAGAAGRFPGGGGAGGCRHTSGAGFQDGGAGADGVVIVELYY